MVNHFRGRIHYYALWNEQDIRYWNPYGNPDKYGKLLAAFAPAVPSATSPNAPDTCQCASQLDIFAYHTYPGYGQNMENGAASRPKPFAGH